MAEYKITAPDGQAFNVTAPEGLSDEQILSTVQGQATKMGMFKPAGAPASAEPAKPSFLETFSKTYQEGMAAAEPARTQGQKFLQSVVPTTIAGGPAGRIAATAGMSMAEQAGRGDNPLGWETLIDTAVAAGTEALFGALRITPSKLGKPAREAAATNLDRARGLEYATAAPVSALEAVRDRISNAKQLVIPALGTAKQTWEQAINGLRALTGDAYIVARKQIADAMNRAEHMTFGGKKPLGFKAGQEFERRTSEARFLAPDVKASRFSELAEAANLGLKNPAVRGAADVAVTAEPVPGVPAGLFAIPIAVELAKQIPGVGAFVRGAERLSGNQ